MTTETLQLTVTGLPIGTRATLERIGNQNGRSVEDYLRELIEVEVLSQQPFREICAPIREQFRQTGLTEEEFDDLIERERQALWEEQQQQRS